MFPSYKFAPPHSFYSELKHILTYEIASKLSAYMLVQMHLDRLQIYMKPTGALNSGPNSSRSPYRVDEMRLLWDMAKDMANKYCESPYTLVAAGEGNFSIL